MIDKKGQELADGDRVIYQWIRATGMGYVEATIVMIHPNGFAVLHADDGFTNNAWPGQLQKI